MKTIIVDDDKVRSKTIEKWLIDEGIAEEDHISVFHNTNSARAALKENYYDVLILDVVLPKRDDDKAIWVNGIELLKYVNTSSIAKKPAKIIGITAFTDDIQNFKSAFEKYCFTVIELRSDVDSWKERLIHAFSYQASSKIASLDNESPIIAVTVHGIRTFGNWQEQLRSLILKKASFINYQTYKYGYFWGVDFLIPPIRNIQVNKLKSKLLRLFIANQEKQFIFFAHSFGTYIVVKAIEELISSGNIVPQLKIILAGSVLSSNHNLNIILDHNMNNIIINDCGNNDYVLWISEALVPLTGMAGRTGFYGVNNDRLINRYHHGSHSHYFEKSGFMEKFWIPIFWNEKVVENTNTRPFSFIEHGVIEQLIVFSSKIKILYPLLALFLIYMFFN